VVHFDDHDHDLVAHPHYLVGAVDLVFGQVRQADQTVLSGQDLHESAEGRQARHLSRVDLADRHFFGQPLDD
jgi:hypothetical protein